MKKIFTFFAIMMMSVTSSFAEWTKPALPQNVDYTQLVSGTTGKCYLVHVETGKIFNGMKTLYAHNTTAGVDVYGLNLETYEFDDKQNKIGFDCNLGAIFRSSEDALHVDKGGDYSYVYETSFDISKVGNYYRFTSTTQTPHWGDEGTRFWGVIPSQHPCHVYPNANPAVAGNFCDWIFITPETYAVYQPKVLRYYTAVELGDALADAKTNRPDINVSTEQAVYDNEQSTTEQLRAAIQSLTAKVQRQTVFYKVDPSLELTYSATSLDGVTAVITDHDGKKTWGAFSSQFDGQDIGSHCTSVSAWSSKSEYCYVKFYHVAGQADDVYYVKFVNAAGNWYNPRGDWHGNQGCMNVTGDGKGLFVGGNSAHTHGQDVDGGALWKVTKTAEGYALCNVAKGVYAVPGVGVVSGQENGYVSLYSGFTTCNPELEGEYTHYIANNTVDGADFWTIERPNGGNGPLLNGSSFEYWGGDANPRENASFNYYQTINDLPAGKYILSAEMYNSSNGEEGEHAPNGNAGLYIKCGETEEFVGVTEDGTTLKKYSTAEIVVNEGDVVTVGIKSKGYLSARWFVADNFELWSTGNNADQAAADAVVEKINAIGTVEYTEACKALIDEARAAYDALTDDQKALITEAQLKVLTDAEAAYAELKAAAEKAAADQAAADAVVAKINAIGTVEYTDACKALIDAAREAYDALTDDQKALITEAQLKVLTDAEAEYAELKATAEKAAADQAAADAVVEKINAIGTVEYTEACKELIDAAREAYDALTADQKALITEAQLKVLTDAEAEYEELKTAAEKAAADQAAADAVVAKINAIGTVEYTDACKALIDAAREAYDALTDDQKALITEAQLKVLTDAEAAYEDLKAAAEKAVADQAAANAVVEKINAIGTVEYSEACKALIDAAREAYDALTEDQKALITAEQYKVLTDAEYEYQRATGIDDIIAGSSLKDGKYRIGNKVVIIKNGKRYDVQGNQNK